MSSKLRCFTTIHFTFYAQIHLPTCNGLSHFVTRSLCDCQMELDFHILYPTDVVYAILHFHPAHNGQNLTCGETRTNTCTMCKVFVVPWLTFTLNRRTSLYFIQMYSASSMSHTFTVVLKLPIHASKH